MIIIAYLLYFVWFALWFESVRYGVFYDPAPVPVTHWVDMNAVQP